MRKRWTVAALGLAALSVQAARADEGAAPAVASSNTRFALDLYARLGVRPGNLFFSPYSISAALAMTYAGARGDTAAEMARVLRFTIPQDQVPGGFSALAARLAAIPEDDATLAIANSLWYEDSHRFDPAYLQLARSSFGAYLKAESFADPGTASADINAWVGGATRGKITSLVSPDALAPNTRLVLCNAIYLRARWASPFRKSATRPAPFYADPGKPEPVPTMHQDAFLRLARVDGASLLEMPYRGDGLSMVIALPDAADGLASLESRLDPTLLAGWFDALGREPKKDTQVLLPRFTNSASFELGQALSALGMRAAFDPDRADFSGMDGARDLFVSQAIHKAFVAVDEEGTEAAAATGVTMAAMGIVIPAATFRADHPFLFLIRENATGTILFMGRLADPK
jgi:serpin B